jgi:hypothetical protein
MAFVTKSYRTDPPHRAKFRSLAVRWFQRVATNLLLCIIGRGSRPPDLALAQMAGGLWGLLGEYSRSLERTRRIREEFEGSTEAVTGRASPA